MDLVERLIDEGEAEPGSLLPTQHQLAERAGVSLITVRRALDELERAGRVTRHQGVGTFVTRPRIVSEPARAGSLLGTFIERVEPHDLTTEVLDVCIGTPRPTVARALRLDSGDPVWRVVRLRRIDREPRVLEQALIPQSLAPGLDDRRRDLVGSLYELLALEHGLIDAHEEQYLEVCAATVRERRLLRLPANTAIVRLRGVSFTPADVPFDCFEQVYPADAFAFYIAGQTATRLVHPGDLDDWGVRPVREKR